MTGFYYLYDRIIYKKIAKLWCTNWLFKIWNSLTRWLDIRSIYGSQLHSICQQYTVRKQIKRTLSCIWGHQDKAAVLKTERVLIRIPQYWHSDLRMPASRTPKLTSNNQALVTQVLWKCHTHSNSTWQSWGSQGWENHLREYKKVHLSSKNCIRGLYLVVSLK